MPTPLDLVMRSHVWLRVPGAVRTFVYQLNFCCIVGKYFKYSSTHDTLYHIHDITINTYLSGGGHRNGDNGRRSSGAREDPRSARRRAIKQMLAGVGERTATNRLHVVLLSDFLVSPDIAHDMSICALVVLVSSYLSIVGLHVPCSKQEELVA